MSLNETQSDGVIHAGPKLEPPRSRGDGPRPEPPLVLCLDAVPATAANQGRIRRRIETINREFRERDVPFQLRLL